MPKSRAFAAAIAFFYSAAAPAVAKSVRIEGLLLERGTRNPLSGVSIHILPSRTESTTDSTGHFVIDEVPVGDFQWAVRLSGYGNLDQNDHQDSGATNSPRILYLEKLSYQIYETTIHAGAEKRDAKTRAIEKEEFRAPGASNDAIKAVQNLPGATTPSFFTPALLIEGGAPEETRYALESFRVPTVFHFGGFSTVVPADVFERVDFLTSGYGPEYGQALGGHIIGWSVSPSRERLQGFGFIDVFNIGGTLQGPVGEKSAYLGSARFGYVGPAAAVFAQSTSLFNLTSVPIYTDGSFLFQSEITPKLTFKTLTAISYDTLGLQLKDPIKDINQGSGFVRILPQLTYRATPDSTLRLLAGLGKDFVRYSDPLYNYNMDLWFLSARAELEQQNLSWWRNMWGVELTETLPQTTFSLPEYNRVAVSQALSSYSSLLLAPYWRTVLHPEQSIWTISPGIRLDYVSKTSETLPQPRLEMRLEPWPIWSLRAAAGLYTQAPPDHYLDPSYGNPNLKSEQAWHATAGMEFDFREGTSRGVTIGSDFFYKYMSSLAALSNVAGEHFNNSGYGHAFGGEWLIRMQFGDFKGWIAYTLTRSSRASRMYPTETQFGYDQTHALSIIASYNLPRNWRLSARGRGLSKPPNSPFIAGRVGGIYLPKPGSFMSEGLPDPPYFQLDLRVDKTWIYDRWMLSLYLDISNITFAQSSDGRTGLPFVPVLGVKGEF